MRWSDEAFMEAAEAAFGRGTPFSREAARRVECFHCRALTRALERRDSHREAIERDERAARRIVSETRDRIARQKGWVQRSRAARNRDLDGIVRYARPRGRPRAVVGVDWRFVRAVEEWFYAHALADAGPHPGRSDDGRLQLALSVAADFKSQKSALEFDRDVMGRRLRYHRCVAGLLTAGRARLSSPSACYARRGVAAGGNQHPSERALRTGRLRACSCEPSWALSLMLARQVQPEPGARRFRIPAAPIGVTGLQYTFVVDVDVAAARWRKDPNTLRTVYQQADSETLLRVALEGAELREAEGGS